MPPYPALPFVIRITGPESSGKSTLARDLAWVLDGYYVAEQARQYLTQREGRYEEADLPLIERRQARAELAGRCSGASFVVCDTGPETLVIWSQVKYGRVARSILRAERSASYDLTVVCTPDLPWVPDPLRESPTLPRRLDLFARYLQRTAGTDQMVVAGSHRLDLVLQRLRVLLK